MVGIAQTEPERGYAVLILPLSKWGIILVRDHSKPYPVYWKLPSGGKDSGEIPLQTAVRELDEETGLKVHQYQLTLLLIEDRGDHDLYFYAVIASSIDSLKDVGDAGEEVKIFSNSEFDGLDDFFPSHRKLLELDEVRNNLFHLKQ